LTAQIIGTPCGIALLGQKDFATGSDLDIFENLKILLQQTQIDQITGRGQFV
jgi:hypothetical protein